MRAHLTFHLNGRPQHVNGPAAFRTLTDWLRRDLGHCGTKVVCAEGDCGACTVLVGTPRDGSLHYRTADACILFLHQIDGRHIVTVEGLTPATGLHPIQQALVERHGSQCGYCTPGFVMALAGMTEAGIARDATAVKTALTGNLCRCTGYLPILAVADDVLATRRRAVADRDADSRIAAALAPMAVEAVRIEAEGRTYFAPTLLAEALAFKAERPEAVIVAGATELGVLRNKRGLEPTSLLSLARVGELDGITVTGRHATIGANATWAEVETFAAEHLPAFLPIVRRFGSPQIRHLGTLVGNVANGSPIADSLPLLFVAEAEVELASVRGSRRVPITDFYTGYKTSVRAADEIITRIHLPLPPRDELLRCYKVSRRLDLDIATFGAAVRVRIVDQRLEQARIAYSGVGPMVVRLPATEEFLTGQAFTAETFVAAGRIARGEIAPITDVRGSRDFRWQLAENILSKFHAETAPEPLPTNGLAHRPES